MQKSTMEKKHTRMKARHIPVWVHEIGFLLGFVQSAALMIGAATVLNWTLLFFATLGAVFFLSKIVRFAR